MSALGEYHGAACTESARGRQTASTNLLGEKPEAQLRRSWAHRIPQSDETESGSPPTETGQRSMTTPCREIALIVGAGSGLSASLARLFSREGMRVAIAARNTAKLAALSEETGAQSFACNEASCVHGRPAVPPIVSVGFRMSFGAGPRSPAPRFSLTAISATCLPWKLAPSSSFSVGCREPSAPASVVAP